MIVYEPRSCGWAMEFKVAATQGRVGMWECVLGRNSLMILGAEKVATPFFEQFLQGVPEALKVPYRPGDIDPGSKGHLNRGPGSMSIFVMNSLDDYSWLPPDKLGSIKELREKAEDMVDYVFGYLGKGRFKPVAGPAAAWRIIMSV